MVKAGAGPSQELVDCYEMQQSGQPPILGYNDANHLQPNYNPLATDYDPANPYEGRDPRFYASIYYNGSPRALSDDVIKDLFPITLTGGKQYMNITENPDGSIHISTTGTDPYVYSSSLGRPLTDGTVRQIAFEYKSNRAVDAKIYWWDAANPEGRTSTFPVPQATDWARCELRINDVYEYQNFGKAASDYIRFDIPQGGTEHDYEMDIRYIAIEVFTPPPPAQLVETYAGGGNCGISDKVTDTRFTRTGYYLRKFNNFRSGPTVDADGFMKIFRLGELYLNFAEAAYQAYGADAPVTSTVGEASMTAREAVNTVRARAAMPPLPAGMPKADFEKRYRNERRIELAFEEHRFFDVRRWKILNETDAFVTGMRITKAADGSFTYTRFKLADRNTNSDKYLMYPIRQDEVLKMEEATGVPWQNPLWN
jgi:hypothetical protein